MLGTVVVAISWNRIIVFRIVGLSLQLIRSVVVTLFCGTALLFGRRMFYQLCSQICSSDMLMLACTVLSVGILYIVVLRLMGIRLLYYLSKRIEKPYLPRLHMCYTA